MKVLQRLDITISGDPVGKGRPRFVRATGRTYTPENTAKYENLVRVTFATKYPDHVPIDTAVSLTIRAYFKIPESWPKYKKQEARDGGTMKTSKPDIDNIIKSICDGLNGVAWTDDARIAMISASKYYSDQPRVVVMITYDEEEPDGGDK